MPSREIYKKMLGKNTTVGSGHKYESDVVMEATWNDDINSRIAYFYDYYHDNEPYTLRNLHPYKDKRKTPIEIKFLMNAAQTLDKDAVSFHIQFKPSFNYRDIESLKYYKQDFESRYDAIFPIGLYVDIPDDKGKYNKWLVVAQANFYVTQFPTFEVLPCDKVIQYIIDNTKYQIACALRSQNSYNSGIWTDYKFTTIEDQQKFSVSLNRDTEKLYYNQRLIIDGKVLTEPRAWHITKINRLSPNGIARITLAQDIFDEHKDYIELDDKGNVIGMWANYYDSAINPTNFSPIINEPDDPQLTAIITHAGLKPEVKVGGSYKKLSVNFYNGEEHEDVIAGTWKFSINDIDISDLLTIIIVDDSQIKIKFNGDDSYIGQIIDIQYITSFIESEPFQLEIVSL